MQIERRIKRLDTTLATIDSKLQHLSMGRVISASAILSLLVSMSFDSQLSPLKITLALSLSLLFYRLVSHHQNHKKKRSKIYALQNLYGRIQLRQKGLLKKVIAKKSKAFEIQTDQAHLNTDFNILGPVSLEKLFFECFTTQGHKHLFGELTSSMPDHQKIISRHEALEEMSHLSGFCRRMILATEAEELLDTNHYLRFFLKSLWSPLLQKSFPLIAGLWIISIIMLMFDQTQHLGKLSFLCFSLLHLFVLGKTGAIFLPYLDLLKTIPDIQKFQMRLEKLGSGKKFEILLQHHRTHPPSKIFRKISILLGFLSTETHMLVHFIVNALMPWTTTFFYFLENERRRLAEVAPKWIKEVAEFELLLSFHIANKYLRAGLPKISDEPLRFKGLQHPLIERAKAISNDFEFTSTKKLALITGSNMSGKSTFLKAVGTNQLLAMAGGPTFSQEFVTPVARVLSSIRLTDSIEDGYSFFLTEVKKIREIIEASQSATLFLVDEVFKGTNNQERLIGARAVISTLSNSQAFGFISSHDLELTKLDQTLRSLFNWHFADDFDKGMLQFSYKLRPGPCTSTNALKILSLNHIL